MGRLDRYVTKAVLGSYFATLVFVVFLWGVVDLLLNLNKYHELIESMSLVDVAITWLRFHLVSLPWLFVLLSPFVAVVGSMFAIARLMSANEVTPMIFTGRSTARVLMPCLATGAISAGLMTGSWEVLVPSTSQEITELQMRIEEGKENAPIQDIVLFSADKSARIMIDRYWSELQRIEGVIVLDRGTQPDDLSEISAAAALWNPERHDWELQDGMFRSGAHIAERAWLGMPSVTPETIWLSAQESRSTFLLSFGQLRDLIAISPERADLVVARHYHLTWPLATLVLLMLAMPFAVHFERGGKVGRVMFAIVICAAYLVVDITCQSLGRREFLHPVLATWTPTILFGSLGAVMFTGMRT